MQKVDALLIVSFGAPEGRADILPFLENVLRGRNVPESRKLEVAKNYERFGGVSPLNTQNRELKKKLEGKLQKVKIYLGNRNWKPYLKDTVGQMKKEGVKNALAFVTSAFDSYSGNQQYVEDIERARTEVGEGAPQIEKIRLFFDHPLFLKAIQNQVQLTLEKIPEDQKRKLQVLFSAHSIPVAGSENYLIQLKKVVNELKLPNWNLVFQSRSGSLTQPWLEPDLLQKMEELKTKNPSAFLVIPIGFVSDHMEVIYDLDVVAKEKSQKLGIPFYRSSTPGGDPDYLRMIVEMVNEKLK
jgi:ferrochelatase